MANGAGIVKHFAAVVAAVLLSALALLGTSPAARAESAFSGDVLALLNAERSAAGLPPLSEAADLTAAAQLRAESMASTGRLEHTRSLTRVVVPGDGLGENVGYAGSVQDLNREFMASSSHRSAILSSSYDEVGVGVVPGNGVIWVTEIFRNAAPSTRSAPSKPSRPAFAPAPERKAPAAAPSAPVPVPVPAPVPVPLPVPVLVAPTSTIAPSPTPLPVAPRVDAAAGPSGRVATRASSTAAPKPPAKAQSIGSDAIAVSAPDVGLRVAATAAGMVGALFALVPVRLFRLQPRRSRSISA